MSREDLLCPLILFTETRSLPSQGLYLCRPFVRRSCFGPWARLKVASVVSKPSADVMQSSGTLLHPWSLTVPTHEVQNPELPHILRLSRLFHSLNDPTSLARALQRNPWGRLLSETGHSSLVALRWWNNIIRFHYYIYEALKYGFFWEHLERVAYFVPCTVGKVLGRTVGAEISLKQKDPSKTPNYRDLYHIQNPVKNLKGTQAENSTLRAKGSD